MLCRRLQCRNWSFLDGLLNHVVRELNVEEVLKLPIFVVQKAAAPKNGVEFCQGSNGTIRSSLATSCDVSRRRATSREVSEFRPIRGQEIISHRHTHTQTENRHTGRPCSTSSAFKNSTSHSKSLIVKSVIERFPACSWFLV